jgi:tetratricopeptide (TPR) repeat protein
VLALAVYGRALGNGFVSLDDEPYVTDNAQVRAGLSGAGVGWAFATTREANWHPLTWISHMLDVELFGLRPFGHHLVNVLIHVANALLVLLLWARMTGRVWPSAAVAALFAIHPLRVESVAWVSERKDVLCAFFGILAILAYVAWVRRGARGAYVAALSLYAMSLLSKPMLVTLPFLLLLLDFWPLGRLDRGPSRRLFIEKVPFLALSAASCAVTLWAQASGGAIADWGLPFAARASNALVSCLAYLTQTFAPVSLSVLYPHPGRVNLTAAAGAAAVLLGVSAAALAAARRRPYFAVGWFWYLGMLVPVIGLVQVGWQARADRYTYLPSIGLAVAVVWGLSDLAGRSAAGLWLLRAAAVALVGCLSFLTWRQIGYWKDSATLYAHGLAVTQSNHILHIDLGIEEVRRGRLAEGIGHFEQAVAIQPGYWYGQLALGSALNRDGRPAEAIAHLETAARLHPDSAETKAALAQAAEKVAGQLYAQGRTAEAAARLEEAVRAAPDNSGLRYEHGRALAASNRNAEAKDELRAAVRLSPDFRPALMLLAAMLATSSGATPAEGEEALQLAERLVSLGGNRDPNDLDLLAAAQAQTGRYAEAVETAQRAILLADAAGEPALSRVIAGRLAFYRARRAYRAGSN